MKHFLSALRHRCNRHTQVDGPTEIVDEDRTGANKAMVHRDVFKIIGAAEG